MGWFTRARRAIARIFSLDAELEPQSTRRQRGDDFGAVTAGDSGDMPEGWRIEATTRHGDVFQPYEGTLPDYVTSSRYGRVIVSFTHPDGAKTYRTIWGPVNDEDQIADIIRTNTVIVSPP